MGKSLNRAINKVVNKAGKTMQKKIAPALITGLGKSMTSIVPGGFLLNPLIDLAARDVATGKNNKLSSKKYFKKAAWSAVGADNKIGGSAVKGVGNTALHGNSKYIRNAAPDIMNNVGTAISMIPGVGLPASILLNPYLDAAGQSIKDGNAKSFKNLKNPKKLLQKTAWGGINFALDEAGLGDVNGLDSSVRGGLESVLHGNSKHFKNRTGDFLNNYNSYNS
jgi:hypothetical protein